MATLDSFREATGEPIQLDLANGYLADIRLNAGDVTGRTITVELTDNGTPITDTTGITVALAYNTSPGSGLGDRVSMPAVFGTPTATYRVAVPRKALQHAGAILMGIEVSVNGTKTCSRNFHGIVERALFDATEHDAQDQMGVLDKLIDDATTAINKAVSAAGEAKDAADAARTSVIEYRQLSDDCKAKIAASAAISPSECLRCFHDMIGTTPNQYLRDQRTQRAAELLCGTGLQVSEIAAQCGFQDASYFARAFRQVYGCGPTEYRRKARRAGAV